MIKHHQDSFYLQTKTSSYWFRVTDAGHLEHLYFGPPLPIQPAQALALKRNAPHGSTIDYLEGYPQYCLDNIPLETSGVGQGDYRTSPLELTLGNGSRVTDFVYRSHQIVHGVVPSLGLPVSRAKDKDAQTLIVSLTDRAADLTLELLYTVFSDSGVIARRTRILNGGAGDVQIHRLDSMMLDLVNRDFEVVSFDGAWIKETHTHVHPVTVGSFVRGSTTGNSSNRQNPGFLLKERSATESAGSVYAFNLVYSGNHHSTVQLDSFGLVRVSTGINPQGFQWPLAPGETFETPEAIMCFADGGLNALSAQLHDFVCRHIQPSRYEEVERPVVFNGWEAMFFDFDEARQLKLAKQAKHLGVELFVVDDGWFEGRDDDTGGLGNFEVDRHKFKNGLRPFAKKINDLGMEFGLWFEPEMVNADSELYRAHPDWILSEPGRNPKTGRNQYVLDLCNPEVCDYLVEAVGQVLDSANISYVKWDMNRHIADRFSRYVSDQGMVLHRYMLGLYSVLERVFEPRPHVLLESCSSGGNRFDLGMLTYSAMIWSSDDTDPIERLEIQRGLSYLYPLCAISAHVSNAPHQSSLRDTPLSTRFNVACFGALGYEYDLELLSREEKQEIKGQIKFYKKHRRLFQFGQFRRHDQRRPDLFQWQVGEGDRAIVGNFQRHIGAAPGPDFLAVKGLEANRLFEMVARPQRIALERFGALVQHVLPVKLDPRGMVLTTAGKYYSLRDAKETYRGTGSLFGQGVALNMQFVGTGHNDQIRLLGDYGSTLYVVKPASEQGNPLGKELR